MLQTRADFFPVAKKQKCPLTSQQSGGEEPRGLSSQQRVSRTLNAFSPFCCRSIDTAKNNSRKNLQTSETVAETTAETVAKTLSESTAETIVKTASETAAETVAERTADTLSESTAETIVETIVEITAETTAETAAETTATKHILYEARNNTLFFIVFFCLRCKNRKFGIDLCDVEKSESENDQLWSL